MKFMMPLMLAATLSLLTACNNDSNSSTTTDTATTDTTTMVTTHDTHGGDNALTADTAQGGASLMKASGSMMDKMHAKAPSGDFDIDYANMMIEHHQGAIDLSQVELSQGKDEKLKSIAQQIIDKQRKEQQALRAYLKSAKPSGMKHGEGELQKSMEAMMTKMKGMQMANDVDKDFATMMIDHHQAGIAMAKLQVTHGMDSKLTKMAKAGIADHQKEIKELETILAGK